MAPSIPPCTDCSSRGGSPPNGKTPIADARCGSIASLRRGRGNSKWKNPIGTNWRRRLPESCGRRRSEMWDWARRRWSRADRELDREIQAHVEWEAEDLAAGGMPLEEARAAARRTFGNAARIQEECREMSARSAIEALVQDLSYAGRVL